MSQKEFVINENDIKYILGSEYESFKKMILSNVRCINCSPDYSTTIIDYTIKVTAFNDLLFKGKCVKCGNECVRATETGENPEYVEKIKIIKKKMEVN